MICWKLYGETKLTSSFHLIIVLAVEDVSIAFSSFYAKDLC